MSAHCHDCGADMVFSGEYPLMVCPVCELRAVLISLREPLHLAYGYLVALVNHGGETKVAAIKAKEHLREAVRLISAAVPEETL